MASLRLKTCACCGKEKVITEFHKEAQHVDGLSSYCKPCRSVKAKQDREKYRQRRLEIAKKYRDNNREKVSNSARNSAYQKRYGITLDDYNKMFAEQEGCCLICGRHQSQLKRRLVVDHSHKTGKIRGLLCSKCNAVLGWLETHSLFGVFKEYIDE